MVKGIFWDNDGVLVDTEHLYFQATAEVLAEAGIELSRETFIEISLRRGESVFCLAEDRGCGVQQREQMRLRRNARYGELLRGKKHTLDGVEETLQALHGRCLMAVVTSSRRDHFEIIHENSGLLGYFDFILTREDYTHSKPHPEPYLSALKRSGLPAERCLVVEDSERGLQAAVSAGLRCLVTPGELTRGGDFTAAWQVLEDVRQVPLLVR
ncbi:haloacid dehalogenase [Desulfuromonas versatilis]|uniref:Haloacid dehalogenase n=1 Tax=Desulfuromonas versatilis TaxID=2802975 RepID=A0ABM8HUT0_9BACT|nr:HAD family phosphatase [Desulfuromonas versatilis]BCR05733.1 haloacid dehalogenase [Desulfuromonas versatilis]